VTTIDPLIAMERAVLGALIESPEHIAETLDRVPPEEWSGPHVLFAETLEAMTEAAEPVDPVTLLDKMRRAGTLIRAGGGAMIHTLVAANTGTPALAYLVDALEVEAVRRQGQAVGTRLLQALDSVTVDPEEAIYDAKGRLDQVQQVRSIVQTEGWPEAEVDPQPVWVIPGLLAEYERLMLTGYEGLGKTMLLRQLVVSVAIGRHPFSWEEFEPKVALHVDLENPQHLSDSGYRLIKNGMLRAQVDVPDLRSGTEVEQRDRKLHRITRYLWDAENSRDVGWLMRAVRILQPKLIAIGPMKNMTSGNLNDEDVAVRVMNVLNRIRAEVGAALIVEAHAGHGSRNKDDRWRPRGSSSLLGWPEFGLALVPVEDQRVRSAELLRWRGPRAERDWPDGLVAGTPWPWVEQPI
jgi:hypothetical protein